jgi:hypothetical protein
MSTDSRTQITDKRALTLIEKLQLAVFEFLTRQDLPLVANCCHPTIIIEMKGRMLTVRLIGEDTTNLKRLDDTSTYILDRTGNSI